MGGLRRRNSKRNSSKGGLKPYRSTPDTTPPKAPAELSVLKVEERFEDDEFSKE